MGNSILVTFKNNDRDKELKEFIESQHSKSGYIKDAVEFYRKYRNIPLPEPEFKGTNNSNFDVNANDVRSIMSFALGHKRGTD